MFQCLKFHSEETKKMSNEIFYFLLETFYSKIEHLFQFQLKIEKCY